MRFFGTHIFLILASVLSAGAQQKTIFPTPKREPLPNLVVNRCNGCHAAPFPDILTRQGWAHTIPRMYDRMADAKIPLKDPQAEIKAITDYYVRTAPEAMRIPPDDLPHSHLVFQKQSVGIVPTNERPQITNIRTTDLDKDGRPDAIVTENEENRVSWIRQNPETGEFEETVIAEIPAPVRSHLVDFDNDGDLDIAVAAMGFMYPNDDLIGEVHLLLNRGDQTFENRVLISGVARIADTQSADIDGDGDLDFVLSQFGWRKTGGFAWIENPGNDSTAPFKFHDIVRTNGAMQLVMHPTGFYGLVTQQHEAIIHFENVGGGVFTNSAVARVANPAFGSSWIEPVDLDGDGDMDLLYTNGDMMDDDPVPKSYHGARWLENQGEGNGYRIRDLVRMPGCYCAKAADMDGDGDLDIVVSSLYFHWDVADFPSLIWLENDGQQNFTAQTIDYAPSNLASFGIGDFNGDGTLDVLAGGMHVPGPLGRKGRLTLWTQPKKSQKIEAVPAQPVSTSED